MGDATIYQKVIGVASAGSTGGQCAVEQLVRTISWEGGWFVTTLGIASPKTKTDESGSYNDKKTLGEIGEWVSTVVAAVEGTPQVRSELLSGVVSPFGIDPARFGEID